jgi:hypothetical protein
MMGQNNSEKCSCFHCSKVVEEGEYMISLSLDVVEVVSDEQIEWIASVPDLALCQSCYQNILKELSLDDQFMIFPDLGKPEVNTN